jgi:hypothetical protein
MSGSWGIGRDILVSARASDAAVDVQTMPAPAQEPLKVASGLLRRSDAGARGRVRIDRLEHQRRDHPGSDAEGLKEAR